MTVYTSWVLIILLFAGCSNMSINNRMDLAMKCGKGTECDLLWDDYNKAAERLARRNAELAAGNCGQGKVLFCNRACMANKRDLEVRGICIIYR